MTSSIASVSPKELKQRRQQLRRQRRARLFQRVWRVMAVSGMAAGLVWLVHQPVWQISSADQIKVEGNRYIPSQTIRSLVPISYPQSLLWLKPHAIAETLKSKAPISEVVVNRQLFPPGLVVQVRERRPVAIALLDPTAQIPTETGAKGDNQKVGLVDANGWWIPIESYTSLDRSLKLPTLRIIGRPEHYLPFWVTLYPEIAQSPVKISEINCQNPANVILKTELGWVHLGPPSSQFGRQLKTLDRMRKLPNQVNLNQLAYIDLRNPDTPVLQLVGGKESQGQ